METKENNGITLVALVVTIVVLLILAGVSINLVLGENGLIANAKQAKEKYLAASEEEAISSAILVNKMNKESNGTSKTVGKQLYTKNFANSDKWDYIFTISDKKEYGDGWYYITNDTELENYGKASSNWIVNYETGEMLKLDEGTYTEMSVNNIINTNGLVFNMDSNDNDVFDASTWGEGITLYGFENDNKEDSNVNDGIYFDGVDDYIEFKAGNDFGNGFTFSFYGKPTGNTILAKQVQDPIYSCRFGWEVSGKIAFNTSKKKANSEWAASQDESNYGNLVAPYICKIGYVCYIDITFNPDGNKFIIYVNGKKETETIVDSEYWNGTNGGKQIFENPNISCYVGRWFGGYGGKWNYTRANIYNMKLYNRYLTADEIEENYMKTIAYHNN